MKIEKMKNENKMRGRGVQFGLKGGNQNHPKSKNQKKMKIEIEINDIDIINLLDGALEGGSNYWYFLPDLSMLKINKKESFGYNVFYNCLINKLY